MFGRAAIRLGIGPHSNSFSFNAGVDIRDTKFSDLVILSHIVSSKKSIKTFYYLHFA